MGESVSFESLTVVVIGGTPSGIRISPDTSITPPSLSNPGAPRGRGFFPPDNLHCLLFRPRKNMICGDLHDAPFEHAAMARSEEHTSELQSLMRISYAVFCLKKK